MSVHSAMAQCTVHYDHVHRRPPRCLTCPCYLSGLTPCIGILTVLSNLQPVQGPNRPSSLSDWLKGGSLLKPEIFHHRWRTDKDPTVHLDSFDFIVKKPLSHSRHETDTSEVILEDDIKEQFNEQMTHVASLNDQEKLKTLKQLKPVMNQFKSIVSRSVRDAKLLKTCQGRRGGRSSASVIEVKKKGGGGVGKPKYHVTGSAASSIARAKNHGTDDTAASRKTKGNNMHIPDDEKWFCPLCKTRVKNTADLIAQHKRGSKHNTILKTMRHCETCDLYYLNTPEENRIHFESLDHQRNARLDAEPDNRDGRVLAQKTRSQNGGAVVQHKKKRDANAGVCSS